MAYEIKGQCISVVAPAQIAMKYAPVKMTSTGIALATADTDNVIGFVQREGIAGEALPVMIDGVTMAVAGEAITKGAEVMVTTGSKVIPATSTKTYVGIALEAATASGDIIAVLLKEGTK